jgi:myo-inositol-1(or 4)-monophosphatase
MKSTAIRAAKEAGKIIAAHYRKDACISFKGSSKNLLTNIDIQAEKAAIETIKKSFPHHAILSEETGTQQSATSEYRWIIDPLDGTTNYAAGLPYFSVSIALAKKEKIVLGVVYEPVEGNLYLAEKGKGAFLNNRRIAVSSKRHLNDAILSFCLPYSIEKGVKALQQITSLFPNLRAVRNIGSAALSMCNIARGAYDLWFGVGARPWDAAAGSLIVEEAGGKVTDAEGKPWNLGAKAVIATNKKLHTKFLKLLNGK